MLVWGRFNQDGHEQSLIRGKSAVTPSSMAELRKEAWAFVHIWLLPDRVIRKGDMLFAGKASHPWWGSAFSKTFTLH